MLGDSLRKALEQPAEPASYPGGYYSRDGECVFVYSEGGEYVAERIDDLLTVFRAPDDARIIGLQIKSVKPGEVLGVGVQPISRDHRTRVDAVILLLRTYKQQPTLEPTREAERERVYRDVLASFGGRRVEVEMEAVCN